MVMPGNAFIWPGWIVAYVDPTAGGVLLQIILGGLAGLFAVLKLSRTSLRFYLRRRFRRGDGEEAGNA
ncbi:MAG: hypothetical protein HY660_13900 [Armatimonadetes bacterium]|nr:hypothetical protein [Armatimonadota bacterium]